MLLIKEVSMRQTSVDLVNPENDEECKALIDYKMVKTEVIDALWEGEPYYKTVEVAEMTDISYFNEKGEEFSPSDEVLSKWYRPVSDALEDL